MTTATPHPSPAPQDWTLADLLNRLGDVPPERVLMVPTPGIATEQDIFEVEARTGRLCELVDGVLVEKAMGICESAVAIALGYFLKRSLRHHRLGVVLGADGPHRTSPQRTRMADVAFVSWDRLGARRLSEHRVVRVAPDLAVEILSRGNTQSEMQGKLREYFAAGVRLVWYMDPRTRTAESYTAPDQSEPIGEDGCLSGGEILPAFEFSLAELFAEADGISQVE